jgi:serine/threonine protein kinase
MGKSLFGERWRIIEPLSEGGQAWAFLVEDVKNPSDERFVLKKLKNTKRLDRFETEIRAIQSLHHPNVVQIIDHDVLDETPYFVMEYCKHGDLDKANLDDKSTIDKLRIFRDVCLGLGEAHKSGIVHRDVKPANILFRKPDVPVVSDFGICFITDGALDRMTETAEQIGARYYMAPELADGRADLVTPASDVYSLGKLLYFLFKGRVMNRENFDEVGWDLRNPQDPDHSIYHIYNLLRESVSASPKDRFIDANDFAFEVGKVVKVIERNGHALDKNLQHRCLFCASGRYKVTDAPYDSGGQLSYDAARQLGINPLDHQTGAGNPSALRLRILECEWCGHIQMFRINGKQWVN